MLLVFRADVIDDMVGVRHVFLTKRFLGLAVLAVGAGKFAGNGLV